MFYVPPPMPWLVSSCSFTYLEIFYHKTCLDISDFHIFFMKVVSFQKILLLMLCPKSLLSVDFPPVFIVFNSKIDKISLLIILKSSLLANLPCSEDFLTLMFFTMRFYRTILV